MARLRNELGWSQETLASECRPVYDVRQVRRAEHNESGVAPEARRAMVEALAKGIKEKWRAAARDVDPALSPSPGSSDEAQAIVRKVQDVAGVNREALERLRQAARMLAEAEALLREPATFPPASPRRRWWCWLLIAAVAGLAIASLLVWLWLKRPEHRVLEGEDGTGAGRVMMRSRASGERTAWLHAEEVRRLELVLFAPAHCRFRVRYSNDNSGPTEAVALSFDGHPAGSFRAKDTGNGGLGWNVFAKSPVIATIAAGAGPHTVEIVPTGGDGYGIEIDAVDVELGQ